MQIEVIGLAPTTGKVQRFQKVNDYNSNYLLQDGWAIVKLALIPIKDGDAEVWGVFERSTEHEVAKLNDGHKEVVKKHAETVKDLNEKIDIQNATIIALRREREDF